MRVIVCMICEYLHNMQHSARLRDHRRVRLHRPGDARPRARTSRSSRSSRSARTRSPARPPPRSTPRLERPRCRTFVAERGGARRRRRRSSSSASATSRRRRSSRRPRASSSTSPARTGCGRRALRRVVRLRASGRARRLVVRAARALPAAGQADREPGLLCDGGAARARPAGGGDRPRLSRRRREVRRLRCRPRAQADPRTRASCSRTCRHTASGRTSTRRRSRRRSASRSRSSRTCCRSGAACSRPAMSARTRTPGS